MSHIVAMFIAVLSVAPSPFSTFVNLFGKQENDKQMVDRETTITVNTFDDVREFAFAKQRNIDICVATTDEERKAKTYSETRKSYGITPKAKKMDSTEVHVTSASSPATLITNEPTYAFDTSINEDVSEQEVEAELIGFIKPYLNVLFVEIFDDFIYVLSNHGSLHHLILVYENQRPFDLLMIIPLEEVRIAWRFESSKEASCLYIHEMDLWHVGRSSIIWKITLEDHRVTKWMSNISAFTAISATNDGGLLIMTFSDTSMHLKLYDENAELLQSFSLPRENTLAVPFAHAVQEQNGNIIIYDLSESYSFRVRRLNLSSGSITDQVHLSENMSVLVHFKPPLELSDRSLHYTYHSNESCYVQLGFRTENKSDIETYSFRKNIGTIGSYTADTGLTVLEVSKGLSITQFRLRFTWVTNDLLAMFDEGKNYTSCFPYFVFSHLKLYSIQERKLLLVPNSDDTITVLHAESLNRLMVIDFGIPYLFIRGYDRRHGHLLLFGYDNLMIIKLDGDVFKDMTI